ncbi:HIT family protein [Candidatus Uhrbacteria bacterium]|nr:MAG: HIT family protein [Candidatus Uhrbacteria bacterium]
MMETIFSKIIAGEIPCEKVYEDDYAFAFLDITPVHLGHTLVVPKVWSENLLDTDPEILAHVIKAVQKVAKAVKEATGADGINLHQNNGEAAGQKVFHLHFHVIPRFADDGYQLWHGKSEDQESLKQIGEKIRQVL